MTSKPNKAQLDSQEIEPTSGDEMEEERTFEEELKFDLPVDPNENYKATELKLCSLARPHMRAFHYSWVGFFMAFFIWFSIAPLLPEVQTSLDLTDQEIWISNQVSVVGDIFFRFIFGPLCDAHGSRIWMGVLLMGASIPTALTGLANSLAGLLVLRLLISFAGACFVMSQCWMNDMFATNVVGTANAVVGGWGNLGGGVAQLVVGSALFPLFRDVFYDGDAEKAWRTVCVVPAVVAFVTGALLLRYSDDCPRGNYATLKKQGILKPAAPIDSFWDAARNWNSWLLFFQYGCCFGVELTMYNEATIFFHQKWGLSTEKAAAISSIFGFMNIFARGLGGYLSDKLHANPRFNMKGRILIQIVTLAVEGTLIIVFGFLQELWEAILVLTIFAIFVQAAEGSTYALVPYVKPSATGAVSGIVGAGGPTGAVMFGFGFMFLKDPTHAFLLMGGIVLLSSLFCLAFTIQDSSKKEEDPPEQSQKAAEMDSLKAAPEQPPKDHSAHTETTNPPHKFASQTLLRGSFASEEMTA